MLHQILHSLANNWVLRESGHFVTRRLIVGRNTIPYHRWAQSQAFPCAPPTTVGASSSRAMSAKMPEPLIYGTQAPVSESVVRTMTEAMISRVPDDNAGCRRSGRPGTRKSERETTSSTCAPLRIAPSAGGGQIDFGRFERGDL